MLLSDHYKNYRGPKLIKAILGDENITKKMICIILFFYAVKNLRKNYYSFIICLIEEHHNISETI